jgi:hypothetical protein
MIYVILAFVIGFYLGNSSQRREDKGKILDLVKKAQPSKYTLIKPKPKIEPENVPQN